MGELMKIRTQLANAEATAKNQRIMDDQATLREELRQRSQDRVKSWGNTLEALRVKKDSKRQAKIEAEEARRQVQDAEEVAFQAQQRRAAIDRAQKLLFEDTDRVKTFNSKLYLSDALKERELQAEIAAEKKARAKREEEFWHNKTLQQVKEMEAEEERKAEERLQRAMRAKEIQTEQLEEMRLRIVKERLDERHEGELIKARALANMEEEEQSKQTAKLEARQKAMEALHQTRKHASEKAEMDAKRQQEEEETIRKFAEQKERKMQQRAARAAELTNKKQQMRQQMIDRQYEYLMSLRTDEERRLADQIEATEAARMAAEAAKEEKRAKAFAEGRAFNAAQLEKRRQDAEQAAREGRVEAANLQKMFEDMKQRDKDQTLSRRQKNYDLKGYHKRQMEEKVKKKLTAAERAAAEDAARRAQMEEDDHAYLHYTAQTIDQYRVEGKNIKPLTLQVAKSMKQPMISA